MKLWIAIPAAAALVAAGGGCKYPDEETTPPDYDGPGSEQWGSEDVTCDDTEDCLTGEVCIDGICQPDRCGSGLEGSTPPIGQSLVFLEENEVAIADTQPYEGAYWIDGYGPQSSALGYDYSWQIGARELVDVAGGNVTGDYPERYVVAADGQRAVGIVGSSDVTWRDLDFQPVAVAAGDVDGDGIDEIVAVSGDDEMVVCENAPWSCATWSFNSAEISHVDVAVGDVDGDAFEEPVALISYGGSTYLIVSNLDAEETGQVPSYSLAVDGDHARVSAGDLDGDHVAEVVVMLDGGWWGWFDDGVAVYDAEPSGEEGILVPRFEEEIDGHTELVDLVASDVDGDERAEVVLLDGEGEATILQSNGTGLTGGTWGALSVSVAPHRIATADHDGDSPRAELVDGPIPCQGAPVPTNLLLMPPYYEEYSAGFPSWVMFGDGESTAESMADTVSLGLHVDVGVGGSFFDVFAAELSSKVSWRVRATTTQTTSMYIGNRYTMRAMPDVYGPNYGGVVLAWGCFDGYVYEVEDPAGHISGGADGETIVMITPTGGSTSLWSSHRYNAMAEELGTLPTMEIPYDVGQADTYPSSLERHTGGSVDPEDILFPDPNSYTASDVGEIGWWQSVSETESNALAMDTEIGASASVTVAGVKVGGGASVGWGEAYTLTAGEDAMFSGGIPTLADDPDTPEDEYATYSYTVRPWVYLEHYTDGDGNEAAYYVQTYTFSR